MDKNNLNINILYVEDDEDILNETSETLKLFKFNILTAINGKEALNVYLKNKDHIDLILTDIKMPLLNGIELIKEIRTCDSEIPIIITSAHEEMNYFKQSIELNVNDYILKPIDIFKLKTSILKSMEPIFLKKALVKKNKELLEEIDKNNEQHKIILSQSRFAAMGEMISMIAHQWRQPLAAINTASNKIQLKINMNSFNLTKDQKTQDFLNFTNENLKNINEYVQNLTNTVDDFSNFYRKDKQTTTVDIKDLINKAINLSNKMLLNNSIDVRTKYEHTKKSNVFKNEIVHVFLNMIKNSYDNFKEKNIENAQINIFTEDYNDKIKILFFDNGLGIKENIIDKIFEPYFSTKDEKNGSGLGLYMSKTIISKNHNGEITASNYKDGIKFEIIL